MGRAVWLRVPCFNGFKAMGDGDGAASCEAACDEGPGGGGHGGWWRGRKKVIKVGEGGKGPQNCVYVAPGVAMPSVAPALLLRRAKRQWGVGMA